MQTQTTQLRVTLPTRLQGYLQTKASKFGLSLSAYVRNLIINDVQDVDYPIFKASDQVEKSYKKTNTPPLQKDLTLEKPLGIR